MQTGLNTVLTAQGVQPVLVKLHRYVGVCVGNVPSGSTRTLTDGKSDTHGCERKLSFAKRREGRSEGGVNWNATCQHWKASGIFSHLRLIASLLGISDELI